MNLATITLLVLGLLMIVGGAMGMRSGSRVSLIAGTGSGLALIATGLWTLSNLRLGTIGGIVVCGLLSMMFAFRFAKTKKFMPAGMLLVLVDLGLVLLVVSLILR